MLAVRRVRSDGGPLPGVAVRCSGSGLPAEESPEEKRHIFMKQESTICTGVKDPHPPSLCALDRRQEEGRLWT